VSKFYDWRQRYGQVNEHNGWVPQDFWLEPWEKEAIISFHLQNPLEGYWRLTFMMLDQEVVAVSPASVWRVLQHAGCRAGKRSRRARAAASNSHSSRTSTACGCFLYQSVGHVLLLMQRAGWMQSFSAALGFARVHEGG
jgi:hypothetical protein